MNNREFEEYLNELTSYGIKPGLDRIRTLCEKLGNPQDKLKFIHVAGTNGKGSVCAYVSNILYQAGIKVGRFTSPAVFEYRERYWINGRDVSKAALCRNMEIVKNAATEMTSQGMEAPTLFEVETALAFCIFLEAGCEIVVLECGMGGEQDSTNIIKAPLVSVLTSISMDHSRILGNSVEAIAKQKSGIIKRGGHVVTISSSAEVLSVIKAKAALERNDITIVDKDSLKNVHWGLKTSSFDYGKYKNLKISMVGTYQTENAALAVTVVDALKKEKIKVDEESIRKGLLETTWPGRFQIIGKKPMVILDGAHNEDGAKKLAESVEFFLHNEKDAGKIILIYGVLADKEYEKITKIMAPCGSHVITVTPPNNNRALPAKDLAENVSTVNKMVSVASSVTEAVEMAYLLSDADSVIIVFGTLSILEETSRVIDSRGIALRKKETRI